MNVPIDKVTPDPNQPRKTFINESLEGLAETIKNEGVLQPILVDKDYNLIDGERRWRAAKLAGLKEIPVYVSKTDGDNHSLILQLINDIQHEGLPISERDAAWLKLWKELGEPSTREMGKILGKHFTTIDDALERARFSTKSVGPDLQSYSSGKIVSATKFIEEPETRRQVIKKMERENIRTDEAIQAFTDKIKKATAEGTIEEALEEPATNMYGRVHEAIQVILKLLTLKNYDRLPEMEKLILSGDISNLEDHLKTWQAVEGEVIDDSQHNN